MSANILSDLRILVLEDDLLIAMHVESLCRDHGAADVIVKHSLDEIEGSEAELADFDVAIIDVMLSGVSALPFAQRLTERRRPFVLASGYVEVEDMKRDFPGAPVVGKPYTGSDLVGAVASVAGRH